MAATPPSIPCAKISTLAAFIEEKSYMSGMEG
jgi:hypothetical protein